MICICLVLRGWRLAWIAQTPGCVIVVGVDLSSPRQPTTRHTAVSYMSVQLIVVSRTL